MHKYYIYLLLVLVLFVTVNCKKDDNNEKPVDPLTPDVLSRGPAPEGMQKLTATIDSKYNMEGARVMSLFDSTLVSGNKFVLYVPANFDSQVFVSDEAGDKVFALVDTHPGDTVAMVNAKSVSVSLLDLLPAFAALDSLQELQVLSGDFTQSKEFLELQSAVDGAMNNKGDLWDVETSNLINPLGAVSASLIKKYFTLADAKGGRIATTTEIDKWLFGSPGVNAEVGNPVYSYAQVDFKAIKTNSSSEIKTFILKPRDLENDGKLNEPTSQRIGISSLPDDVYRVHVTQKSAVVRDKNAEKLGRAVISFLIGKILDPKKAKKSKPTEGSTQENCIRDVSEAVMEAVKKNTLDVVLSTELNSVGQVVDAVIGIVKDSYNGITESNACLKLSTKYGSKIFIKLVGKRVVTALNVYENIKTYAEFRHIVMSFITPEELIEEVQLHYGRLLTGTVKLIPAKELEIEYKPNEIIYPVVNLSTILSYKDISKEGLLVEWKVKEGHGSVNLLETKLDKSGETTVGWKLPAFAPTADGEVEVRAEITDKEGDHIKGSPVVFKTKVYSPIKMLIDNSPWKPIGENEEQRFIEYCVDEIQNTPRDLIRQTLESIYSFKANDASLNGGVIEWTNKYKEYRYNCHEEVYETHIITQTEKTRWKKSSAPNLILINDNEDEGPDDTWESFYEYKIVVVGEGKVDLIQTGVYQGDDFSPEFDETVRLEKANP